MRMHGLEKYHENFSNKAIHFCKRLITWKGFQNISSYILAILAPAKLKRNGRM